MSRGGFGGGGTKNLGIEIDPALEAEIAKYGAEDEKKSEQQTTGAFVWPEYPGGVPRAPPPTDRERRMVQTYRELTALRHASPRYTGPKGSLKALCNKRTAADFNAFEDQPTYGKKFQKKEFQLVDPKKYKWQCPHFFPKELWSTIGYNPDASEDPNAPKKKLMLSSSKTIADKLAKFDDDAEERGIVGAGDDDDDDDNDEEKDEDAEDVPRDDDFSEDEDDDEGNDYNAEQHFDNGEQDEDEAGADEYGADDGY